MIKSQFHWLRSRACVVTAVEQHAIGADGLAQILTRVASEEGRLYRIAHKVEKMADRVTVAQVACDEYRRVANVSVGGARELVLRNGKYCVIDQTGAPLAWGHTRDQALGAYQARLASHPKRTEVIRKTFGDKVLRK